MRLIDADALKDAIDDEFLETITDEYAVGLTSALIRIDEQPTVDAIPISWLEGLHKTAQSDEADRMIDEIISLWETKKNER